MLVYVWSRRNPYVRMNFFGLLNFQAPFLPWLLLGFSLLLGNSIVVDLLGEEGRSAEEWRLSVAPGHGEAPGAVTHITPRKCLHAQVLIRVTFLLVITFDQTWASLAFPALSGHRCPLLPLRWH